MAPPLAPGHTLVGRYRIGTSLGGDASSELFRADDLSLLRPVVVQALRGELAAHEEVRRAFRDRIIRAAALSHPHVAKVFDGGQESGTIFAVGEYLSGGSLETLLGRGRRLSVEEAARLGRDVASALAYLQDNDLVMGGLSPMTLLFGDDGRVRVGDVAVGGLAARFRERISLNDARYYSPEQAIGESASAASDVYALALVLFEAVTGTTPFEGSTVEATLRARLNAPLPVRAELGTLDMVLAQASIPDPLLRLSAAQFSSRLGAVVDAQPFEVGVVPEGRPLLADFAPAAPRRRTVGFQPPSPEEMVANPPSGVGASRAVGPTARGPSDRRALAHTPRFDASPYALKRARPRVGHYALAGLALVIVVAAVLAWRGGLFSNTHRVPTLVGLSVAQASSILTQDGYTLLVNHAVVSAHVPLNDIATQSPAAGTSAKSGSVIGVNVSAGPTAVTLPAHLVGESCARATAQLTARHVVAHCPASRAIYSSTPRGAVARVTYGATSNPLAVPRGATVTLVLSKGRHATSTTSTTAVNGPRAVPNVVGDNYARAYAAMKRAVLYFTTTGPHSNTTTWTYVISQSPKAGTVVPYRSTVTLRVR